MTASDVSGSIAAAVSARLAQPALMQQLVESRVASRIFAKDDSLWGQAATESARARLDWVESPEKLPSLIDSLTATWRQALHSSEDTSVILCGMGGSSLAPKVIAEALGANLTTVESTHPDELREVFTDDRMRSAHVIVSTKSGQTIETLSLLALCEERFRNLGIQPSGRISVVTDKGSDLDRYATDASYQVFYGDPCIGGRFSALTVFGIAPPLFAGAALSRFPAEALAARELVSTDSADNPSLQVAVALYSTLQADVCAYFTSHSGLGSLSKWIEQLIAESTGKDGRGLLPIATPHTSSLHGHRTVLMSDNPSELQNKEADIVVCGSLPAQFMFWQTTTAVLCHLLQVNPFDQPDVESAKAATRALLSQQVEPFARSEHSDAVHLSANWQDGNAALTPSQLVKHLLHEAKHSRYIALQAYTPEFESQGANALIDLATMLEAHTELPVAVNYGPQYLHSTGQLHKGGPPVGLFVQILKAPQQDVKIPGSDTTFGQLLGAAAAGDCTVLRKRERPVFTLVYEDERELTKLISELEQTLAGRSSSSLT